MHYDCAVLENLDWSRRGDHMHASHGISVQVANDALADPDSVVIDRDRAV